MHGFNRLGGNSLAETVVAGRVVGRRVAEFTARESLEVELALAGRFVAEEGKRVQAWIDRPAGGPSVFAIRDAIAETMVNRVGVFRSGPELEIAVTEIEEQIAQLAKASLAPTSSGPHPELTAALRIEGMARLALITALGALARTESRGAHARTDFPQRDDARWLNRTLAHWPDGATAPELSYEPVGLIDLPPGDRGYGKGDRIDSEVSLEAYNAEVETRQREAGSQPTAEPLGARMKWEAWREVENPTPITPERSK